MGEGGIIAEIDTMDFIKVIGGPLPIVLKKNENSHEVIQILAKRFKNRPVRKNFLKLKK